MHNYNSAEQSRAEQRDYSVDLLRAFGLLLLILAHVDPPNIIFQLRVMDVPLMVFISGISFSLSTRSIRSLAEYRNYVVKRFKRLIIPAWIFIVIFLVVFGICELAGIGDEKFSIGLIARSFLLIDGIGYVWVIRVYFLMAIIAPAIKNVLLRLKLPFRILTFICLALLQQLLVVYTKDAFGKLNIIYQYVFLYVIGYGLIYWMGMIVNKLRRKQILLLAMVFTGIFIVLGVSSGQYSIQAAKYPPQLYYIAYGLAASLFLIFVSRTGTGYRLGKSKSVQFLSKYSLELYFAHVFGIALFTYHIINLPYENFVIRYCVALCAALILTFGIIQLRKIRKKQVS